MHDTSRALYVLLSIASFLAVLSIAFVVYSTSLISAKKINGEVATATTRSSIHELLNLANYSGPVPEPVIYRTCYKYEDKIADVSLQTYEEGVSDPVLVDYTLQAYSAKKFLVFIEKSTADKTMYSVYLEEVD